MSYVVLPSRIFPQYRRATVTKGNMMRKRALTMLAPNSVDIEEGGRLLGHGIWYFVIMYSTLNWLHYRSLRKKAEKAESKK